MGIVSIVGSQVGWGTTIPLVRLAATAPAKRLCGLTGAAGRQPTATSETTRMSSCVSMSHRACGERRTPDRQRFAFTVLPPFFDSARSRASAHLSLLTGTGAAADDPTGTRPAHPNWTMGTAAVTMDKFIHIDTIGTFAIG